MEKLLEEEKALFICNGKAKLINDLSEEEKKIKIKSEDRIPKHVIDNIKDYPASPFLIENKENDIHNWKVVNYAESEDGFTSVLCLDESDPNLDDCFLRREQETIIPSDDELFMIEKSQLEKGILKEISERTFDRHIAEGTLDKHDLKKFTKVSRFLAKKANVNDIAKKENGVVKKTKDW